MKVLAALDQISKDRGTEMVTEALAWVAQQPTVVAPIASARSVEQLPALLAMQDLRLPQSELTTLTAASD